MMNTWGKAILLAAFACLTACGSQSSDEKPKESTPQEETSPRSNNGGDSSSNPNSGSGAPNSRVGTSPTDCGDRVIQKCNLFALASTDLLEIRDQIPQNVNSKLRERGFTYEQIEQIRAARLVQWIAENYPEANVNAKFLSSNDFFKFYKSIKW